MSERLNVTLTKEAKAKLEALQKRLSADTLAETVRKSLIVTDYLLSEKEAGGKIFIKTPDGEKEVVVL